jgi:hypothetical protein
MLLNIGLHTDFQNDAILLPMHFGPRVCADGRFQPGIAWLNELERAIGCPPQTLALLNLLVRFWFDEKLWSAWPEGKLENGIQVGEHFKGRKSPLGVPLLDCGPHNFQS